MEASKPSLTEEQLNERDEEIPLGVHLGRIARELTSIRKIMMEGISYMREAEGEVPEKMRRYMNYMHDVHDVKYMYEELGHPVPIHINQELQRLDDRYKQLLRDLWSSGGAFDKVRQEMAKHKDNRWDHTTRITHMQHSEEYLSETRQRTDEPNGLDQSGTEAQGG